MQNVRLNKKNEDGSYDNGEFLFNSIDFYGGDIKRRILEVAPGINKEQVQYVKFLIALKNENGSVPFVPEKEGSYLLVNELYKNVSFYLEHKSGNKLIPDKKGVINITNLLIQPMDIVLYVKVEPFTTSRLDDEIVMEDLEIQIYSDANNG